MTSIGKVVTKCVEQKEEIEAMQTLRSVFAAHGPPNTPPGALQQGGQVIGAPYNLAGAFTEAARYGNPQESLMAQHMLQRAQAANLPAQGQAFAAHTGPPSLQPPLLCGCGLDRSACGVCGRGWAQAAHLSPPSSSSNGATDQVAFDRMMEQSIVHKKTRQSITELRQ